MLEGQAICRPCARPGPPQPEHMTELPRPDGTRGRGPRLARGLRPGPDLSTAPWSAAAGITPLLAELYDSLSLQATAQSLVRAHSPARPEQAHGDQLSSTVALGRALNRYDEADALRILHPTPARPVPVGPPPPLPLPNHSRPEQPDLRNRPPDTGLRYRYNRHLFIWPRRGDRCGSPCSTRSLMRGLRSAPNSIRRTVGVGSRRHADGSRLLPANRVHLIYNGPVVTSEMSSRLAIDESTRYAAMGFLRGLCTRAHPC